MAVLLAIVGPLTFGAGPAQAVHARTVLHWSPSPLAATGTLGVGGEAEPVVTASNFFGVVPNAVIYLSFVGQGLAEALAKTTDCTVAYPQLDSTPVRCTADANGQIQVRYFTDHPFVPNGGMDTLTAALNPGGAGAATDTYTYATIDHLAIRPVPIAPDGSLGAGDGALVKVTAYDA